MAVPAQGVQTIFKLMSLAFNINFRKQLKFLSLYKLQLIRSAYELFEPHIPYASFDYGSTIRAFSYVEMGRANYFFVVFFQSLSLRIMPGASVMLVKPIFFCILNSEVFI